MHQGASVGAGYTRVCAGGNPTLDQYFWSPEGSPPVPVRFVTASDPCSEVASPSPTSPAAAEEVRMSAVNARRRLVVAGLVAGIAIGAAVGRRRSPGRRPSARRPATCGLARGEVLADPGDPLTLSAGSRVRGSWRRRRVRWSRRLTSCPRAPTDGPRSGADRRRWLPVRRARRRRRGRRAVVLVGVPDGGGDAVKLPDGGAATPFHVVTTAGLREVEWLRSTSMRSPVRPTAS